MASLAAEGGIAGACSLIPGKSSLRCRVIKIPVHNFGSSTVHFASRYVVLIFHVHNVVALVCVAREY